MGIQCYHPDGISVYHPRGISVYHCTRNLAYHFHLCRQEYINQLTETLITYILKNLVIPASWILWVVLVEEIHIRIGL